MIPPAWRKVWICPHANGHIQAVGIDAAGRRQYLHHQAWQDERAEEKFDRALELSKSLPAWRSGIARDLDGRGLSRERVLALALRLLDRGYFRAGGEKYAEEHQAYGLATLRCDHVSLTGSSVKFDYPAKSGVQRTCEVHDVQVVRAVRSLMRRPARGERLLAYRNGPGWSEIRADDLNTQFKSVVGDEYSVKDLRTWHGTVLAAVAFGTAKPADSQRIMKSEVARVTRQVAEALGNTPAVARGSYIDPRVILGYEHGVTIAGGKPRTARRDPQDAEERATRALLRRVSRAKFDSTVSSRAA